MNRKEIDDIFDTYKPEQNPDEIEWLLPKVEEIHPSTILEIGVNNGGSLKFWEILLSVDGLLVGVDKDNNVRWDTKSSPKKIELIFSDSTLIETVNKVRSVLGDRKVDFLFIDGGHDYYIVKSDYENYKQFVRPGGMIAFHDIWMQPKGQPIRLDYWNGSVTRLWLEINGNKEDFQAISGLNIGIGIIRT